jgi:hypothetical protein
MTGAQWRRVLDQHRAVSMAASGRQLSTDELTSQGTWNSREGLLSTYQYAEASQIVQLLRNDIGLAGQMQILRLLGAGRTFAEAYGAVTGRSWPEFAASVPARLRALAQSPGVAFAPDSTAGSGVNGPTFVLYGYQPNAVVTLSIRGASPARPTTGAPRRSTSSACIGAGSAPRGRGHVHVHGDDGSGPRSPRHSPRRTRSAPAAVVPRSPNPSGDPG